MLGTIFDIKRFAIHDGPGIRTTVFFKGCPLECLWCHNPEGIKKEVQHVEKKVLFNGEYFLRSEVIGREYQAAELLKELKEDHIFMDESKGGITISGGEPFYQPHFLKELIGLVQEQNIHCAVDTSGYFEQSILDNNWQHPDLYLWDLKHIDETKHLKYTGVSVAPILANLNRLLKDNISIRIRIPLIPSFNASTEELTDMALFLKSLSASVEQVDLLPFHASAQSKYRRLGMKYTIIDEPKPTPNDIENYRAIFENEGFNVSIGG